MSLHTLTDATFDAAVYQPDLPVLIEFGTEWCAPCKQIEPVLAALSDELEGKVMVARVDIDSAPDAAMRLGVRGIPALFVFKDGHVKANRTGAASKRVLRKWLEVSL